MQRIRKAQSEKRDRMYTYFKEIDHVFRFALYGCVAKIWKSSVTIACKAWQKEKRHYYVVTGIFIQKVNC